MDQKTEQPDSDAPTDQVAAPGESAEGGSVDAPGQIRDVLPWRMESEILLRQIDPIGGWRQWKPTGYAVFKLSLNGGSRDIFLLCLTGEKLREALASIRSVVRQSKLFDEFCRRHEESDPSKSLSARADSHGPEEKK